MLGCDHRRHRTSLALFDITFFQYVNGGFVFFYTLLDCQSNVIVTEDKLPLQSISISTTQFTIVCTKLKRDEVENEAEIYRIRASPQTGTNELLFFDSNSFLLLQYSYAFMYATKLFLCKIIARWCVTEGEIHKWLTIEREGIASFADSMKKLWLRRWKLLRSVSEGFELQIEDVNRRLNNLWGWGENSDAEYRIRKKVMRNRGIWVQKNHQAEVTHRGIYRLPKFVRNYNEIHNDILLKFIS